MEIERPDRALFIDYGQLPVKGEMAAARKLSKRFGVELDELKVDIASIGSGDLAGRSTAAHSLVSEAWPFRNQFFMTVAAMKYASEGLSQILIGTVASDHVHPDGTPEFIRAANVLIKCELPEVQISAPAIGMTTKQLVVESGLSRSDLAWTFSCHKSSVACGECRGCTKAVKLFCELD